ncbi:MAG: 2-C-methyl-D-erythritol 4-phosphate cytidylyltransferase [Verrucomicrobiota bacterium]
MKTAAIIVAAGSSSRMGFDKLFARLDGHPVLRFSLDAFHNCPDVDHILIVTQESNFDRITPWLDSGQYPKLMPPITGGEERYLSVHAGIQALPKETSIVAVHDGARPLITPDQIAACIQKAADSGTAVCARRIVDTVKRANSQNIVTDSVDRDGLWAMETPQVFQTAILRDAYDKVIAEQIPVTDETSAVELTGTPIHLVENSHANHKITYPRDLDLAHIVLDTRAS